MMENIDLFGNEIIPSIPDNKMTGRNKSGGYIENPMHKAYGKIETERCKNCIHITRRVYAKTYYKCDLRLVNHVASPKSDHRANWIACGKFERDIS